MSEPPVIVGAGPAGMRAAETLAAAGLRPIVLDEAPASGGQIYRRQPRGFARPYRALYGFEAAKAQRLHRRFDSLTAKIDYRPNTLVWDLDKRQLDILRDGRQETVRIDRLILATGAMDRVMPFPGWTLPGVYTLGGAQVALKHQACAVGRRTVFLGSSPLLAYVAYQYRLAGASVAAVLDTASRAAKARALPGLMTGGVTGWKGLYYVARLAAHGIGYHHGVKPLRVLGETAVEGLEYVDAQGRTRRIACDAVAVGFGLKCETQLADLAGCAFRFDTASRQWVVEQDEAGRSSVAGIYVAGDGAAIAGADSAELSGERAARALIHDLALRDESAEIDAINRRLSRLGPLRRALEMAFPFPATLTRQIADDVVVCRCETVTAGDIRQAVNLLGADDVNRAKAFCRVGMGRCQGRVCGPAAVEIVAANLGVEVAGAGRLRGQAPVKPVPVAALAESLDVAGAA